MTEKEKKEDIIDFGPIEDTSNQIIKVVGVGGGGCNAVRNMYEEHIKNVTFAVCNTDSKALAHSPIPTKILLGESGLGAGANPELGKSEALNTKETVKKLFSDDTKMCFITAGMGGGTGTGAAPVIASIARSMGILTIGIVTIPFYFEKKRKIIKALKGVEEMRKNVDSLLIINNESICDIYADSEISVKQAFKAADQILCNAAKGISELITLEGNINLDFRDVEATMRDGGGAIMAIGRARGERRVEKAIVNALESPLLYGSDITQAKKILFNIYTSDDAPLFVNEMREVDAFMYGLNPNIDVIWGTSDDNTLGEDAKIIILATGLDNRFMPDNQITSDDDSQYDKIIAKLYREPIMNIREHKHASVNKEEIDTTDDSQNKTIEGAETSDEVLTDSAANNTTENNNDTAENNNVMPLLSDDSTDNGNDNGLPTTPEPVFMEPGDTEEDDSNDNPPAPEPPKPKPSSFQQFLNRLKKHLSDNLAHLMNDDE